MTGGYHSLLLGNYYTSGLVARCIGLAISCLSTFLGLRCASRARACTGQSRARWLLLAGVSIGAIGFWAADFIATLGSTVPGHSIRYNIPVTLLSLLASLIVMCGGLLITGFRRVRAVRLAAASVTAGLGVACMHYLSVAAFRVSARVTYDHVMFAVSVVIAILAVAAVLWAASRLRGVWSAIGTAVIVGIVVSGMHDSGVAAVRLTPARAPAGMIIGGGGGVTADSFLLPLTIGLSVVLFLVAAGIALSPTEEAMRYDQSLLDTISRRSWAPLEATPLVQAANGTAKAAPSWIFAEHSATAAAAAAAGPPPGDGDTPDAARRPGPEVPIRKFVARTAPAQAGSRG
jgi:NO-binding membrane sensor protein with MHYT domain